MAAIESWEWLVGLIDKGSFTRASEDLHISQQTLSARLASLERELGCKLVVRSSPLSLTRAGEAFLDYAREQNRSTTQMLRRLGEVTIGGAGNLKVGISNMHSRTLMPYAIDQFHCSMPGVSVKIIEGTNEELVAMAEQGDADVVITNFGAVHPGVTVRPLYHEEIVLVAKPELLAQVLQVNEGQAVERTREEGLAALGNCPFLLTSPDDISGRIARAELSRAHVKPEVLVESDSIMTLLSLAAQGLGCVFCASTILEAAHDLTCDMVRIPLSDEARYEVSIGRPANVEPWAPAQVFEDVVGALFGEGREA